MHTFQRFVIGSIVLVLSTCLLVTVSAQMDDDLGPTGSTTEGRGKTDDPLSDWQDLPSHGPLGRVEEYLPHEACD